MTAQTQAGQAEKLFRRLDRNGDGVLSADEMPDTLRNERFRWDANRDGAIPPHVICVQLATAEVVGLHAFDSASHFSQSFGNSADRHGYG